MYVCMYVCRYELHACMQTYVQTYVHAYMHTYIHTYTIQATRKECDELAEAHTRMANDALAAEKERACSARLLQVLRIWAQT